MSAPSKRIIQPEDLEGKAGFNVVVNEEETGFTTSESEGGGGEETPAPYLVYTALLSQSGTDAPVATVLQNTLGGTIAWTRVSDGFYRGTLAGAFPLGKVFIDQEYRYNQVLDYYWRLSRASDNIMELTSEEAGSPSDELLDQMSIEIRVYP